MPTESSIDQNIVGIKQQKRELEFEMFTIKTAIRSGGKLPKKKYNDFCTRQVEILKEIQLLEVALDMLWVKKRNEVMNSSLVLSCEAMLRAWDSGRTEEGIIGIRTVLDRISSDRIRKV